MFKLKCSEEDEEWVGLNTNYPSLSYFHKNKEEAMKGIKNLVYEIEIQSLLNGDDLQLDYLRSLGLINSPEFIKDLIKSQLKIFVKRFYLITIIIYAALFLVLYFT